MTWQFTEGENGHRDYYWGRYGTSQAWAQRDFDRRVDDYPVSYTHLDVSVRVIEPVKNLMGFASVKFNDCFVVENLKIVQGSKGLFLGMPSQPDGKGGYRDMAYPVTKEFREQLNTAVLQAYEAKLEQMAERGSVGRASCLLYTSEHDEFTMKPTLDENGRLIPREDYRISSLNCGGEDFAVACMRSNLRYEKNRKREDVKSHHYIISFDPRDSKDNGLTTDRAQELGEQFCKEHFPGHQALVCTHPDGHNHSGNIHVHIVINSLRIYEVPLLPYMDRPADTREGCKHRCTNAAMEYFKSEVMELSLIHI